MASAAPIQHRFGTKQFRCTCGEIVTFSQISDRWTRLTECVYVPETQIRRGKCPLCGQVHWHNYRQ